MDYYPSERHTKMEKADRRVNYRNAFTLPLSESERNDPPDGCHNCRFYEWGACSVVEGVIEANGVSDLWTAQPTMSIYMSDKGEAFALHDIVSKGRSWALFNEQNFAQAPEWIQYFPAPGTFNHPSYGPIVVTEERNQRMFDNFKSGVYQEKLPVDVEHDLGLSGAVGWIDDMRLAADGSVEAHVDWTSNGLELFEQDRFRYFSPAVMPEWSHTVTGEAIPDVAIGGALTTRPYFKEKWLRPLVANEGGGFTAMPSQAKGVPSGETLGVVIMTDGKTAATDGAQGTGTGAEAQVDTVSLSREEYDRLIAASATGTPEGTNDAAKAAEDEAVASLALTDAEAQSFREIMQAGGVTAFREMGETISRLESERRTERFTQMVTGRAGGDDGAPWVGNAQENVAMLLDLAEKFGEDSDRFKAYVTRERGLAQAQRKNLMFSEVGDGGSPVSDTPMARMKAAAAQKMSDGTAKDEREAMAQVASEQPDLYEAYRLSAFAVVGKED